MRLLVSVFLLLLVATASAQNVVAKQNMSIASYQELNGQLAQKGYKLVSLNFIAVNYTQRFNAIWKYQPGADWKTYCDITSFQYQQYFNQLVPQGYMPTDVCIYNNEGGITFSAIWEKKPGAVWEARHDLTSSQYQAHFDRLTRQGYMPMQVSAYNGISQELLFAAIWEKRPGIAWQARHNLSAAAFQRFFDQMASQGYMPKEIFAYSHFGVLEYGCIWHKIPGVSWEARYGLTYDALQEKMKAFAEKGYEPYLTSAYVVNGKIYYIAAWQSITKGK